MNKQVSVIMSIVCLIIFIIMVIATAYVEYQTSTNVSTPMMLGD